MVDDGKLQKRTRDGGWEVTKTKAMLVDMMMMIIIMINTGNVA